MFLRANRILRLEFSAFIPKASLYFVFLLSVATPYRASAECAGSWTEVKLDQTPVYASPYSSSKVLFHLDSSTPVCLTGTVRGFAILSFKEEVNTETEEIGRTIAYVREVDLVHRVSDFGQPKPRSFLESIAGAVRSTYRRIRSGIFSEDPLEAYRPIIGEFEFGSPPKRSSTIDKESPVKEELSSQ